MIQLAQTVATEMGALCSKRFPDLKASIDKAFQSWPLRSVTISVQVNGRDYESPTLAFIVSTIRQDFLAADEGESRKACADYPAFLAKVAGDIPPSALGPFIAPAK
jgi:hypothetical protein